MKVEPSGAATQMRARSPADPCWCVFLVGARPNKGPPTIDCCSVVQRSSHLTLGDPL